MIIFAAFLQAFIFQFLSQTAKRLKEKGVSNMEILYYQRYALWPALLALFFLWDKESADYLWRNHDILFSFVGFVVSLCVFEYVYYSSFHITKSLALVSVLKNAIGLPLLMVTSFLIAGDVPTALEIFSVGLLIFALFLQPKRSDGEKSSLLYPLIVVAGILFAFILLQITKDPLYRNFMKHIPDIWFGLALYLSSAAFLLNVFFWFKKPAFSKRSQREHRDLLPFLIAVPILWLAGSIPEGFVFSRLPVYSMIALGSITFLMSIVSDLYHKRIIFDLKTASFITLVCSSILLNIFAHI